MRNWIRRLTVSVTVVLGFLFLTGVAKRVWAQQAVEKRFDQLDQNKDGRIRPDELPAGEFFKRLDLDGNGEITKSEAARALARGKLNDLMKPSEGGSSDNPRVKQIEAIAKSADADGDGKITREEAADAPWFERADHNGELELDSATRDSKANLTYYGDVARILQQNCVSCHRDNGIAPFSLADLDSVQDHVSAIKRVVTEGTMPPWFAANQQDSKSNPLANDCSLSSRDKSDLLAWIESKDRPLGEQTDAPEPKQYPSEWSIGNPSHENSTSCKCSHPR